MKIFIETHLGLMLIGSTVLGLCFPAAALVPAHTVTALLGIVILIACLRIEIRDFTQVAWGQVTLFWLGRFVVLPVIMFATAKYFFPDYAAGILLLALIPAGTSSSAFANVFGGNVPTALFLTLLSSIAAVVLIPGLFETIGHMQVSIPTTKLFIVLLEAILLPGLLAIPLRRVPKFTQLSNSHGKMISILALAGMSVIIIAGQRHTILFEPYELITPALIVFACYLIFMIAALPLFRRDPANRIAVFTGSTYNNTAIGMSLVLIDFPHQAVLTMVMAQLCWTALPLATHSFIIRMRRNLNASLSL